MPALTDRRAAIHQSGLANLAPLAAFRHLSFMRSKATHLLMLTAWLLATGVQWDVVQVLAWGNMFANRVRVLPVRDAWELTFSVKEMCGACEFVQEAKQDESGNPVTTTAKAAQELLVFQKAAAIVIAAPRAQPGIVCGAESLAPERAAPPTPPPRGLA